MIEVKVEEIYNIFDIEKNQINAVAIKALISAMMNQGLCIRENQKLVFDFNIFGKIWSKYNKTMIHFDPYYNRKTDLYAYFLTLLKAELELQTINFHALFCPGYTENGYKDHLGNTTLWKLEELRILMDTFKENNLSTEIICYYSDIFLENCDVGIEPLWHEQLQYNRYLFHEEAKKYFDKESIKNMSDVAVFSSSDDVQGYIDYEIINSLSPRAYNIFTKINERFYNKMGFTEIDKKFRNERLITMYRIFSDYLNTLDNVVFLPMENIYEREIIFSENDTCTMYLKLKK